MSRAALYPSAIVPVLLASLGFAWRALPQKPSPPLPAIRATDLPTLPNLPPGKKNLDLELDAEHSSVRFLVTGLDEDLLVGCPAVTGRLVLTDAGTHGVLELQLDLASLEPLQGAERGLDLAHVLGVHRGATITYRGELVATTSSDLPGVQQRTWLGQLRFGAQVLLQPMQLWQCSLPGKPLRLQGHGTVAGDRYGLPTRHWLALFPEAHAVTLGLDLAWRRRAE